jgi:hypothetical protein
MTRPQRSLRLIYGRLGEPVNGWVLVRCESLDLVSQGRTEADACATLREEAALVMSHAREQGTLVALLGRLGAGPTGEEAASFELDLTQLP